MVIEKTPGWDSCRWQSS